LTEDQYIQGDPKYLLCVDELPVVIALTLNPRTVKSQKSRKNVAIMERKSVSIDLESAQTACVSFFDCVLTKGLYRIKPIPYIVTRNDYAFCMLLVRCL